jgi:SagB-type dehydrogenase family enzyme
MDDRHVGLRIDRVRAFHDALTDVGPPRESSVQLSDSTGALTLREPCVPPTLPLGVALSRRRSRYDYGPIGHHDLSSLLRWALGPQRTVRVADGTTHHLNLHPSAGGLPSTSAYVVALQQIEEITVGVYEFDHAGHRLARRRSGDVRAALAQCLVQPQFAERAPVVIVLAGELDATLSKYSERHYRTLHVDAGLAAANLYLVSTALDLACCAISGFYDESLGEAIGLTRNQIPLIAFAVGAGGQLGESRQTSHTQIPAKDS